MNPTVSQGGDGAPEIVRCPHCGRQIRPKNKKLGMPKLCPGCLRGIVTEGSPNGDSTRSPTPDSGTGLTTEEMTEELISSLTEMKSKLRALGEEFWACPRSNESRIEELTRQYQECLAKHVPEVAELLDRLKLIPAISLHDTDKNLPLIKVYDVEARKFIIIAANPQPYEALESIIEWMIKYVDNPEEEAKNAQSRSAPKPKIKWKLELIVRKWAEACLIDDDDTLSLIKETLVHDVGDLKSLNDAVFDVTNLIYEGRLVLGGDSRGQMKALVIVFHSKNVTLPPDKQAWAEREGLIPLSQKTQIRDIMALDRIDTKELPNSKDSDFDTRNPEAEPPAFSKGITETTPTDTGENLTFRQGELLYRLRSQSRLKTKLTGDDLMVHFDIRKSSLSSDIQALCKAGYKMINRKGFGYYLEDDPPESPFE